MDSITIKGAREHNLKDISLTLPKNSLIVITGISGSGKSTLAFDTIFAEGQRRYIESLSSYARMFLGRLEKPEVDLIEGLSPSIAIEQKSTNRNPRSTVGTITEIYDYYRLLWSRIGHRHCPECGTEITRMSVDQIIDRINMHGEGSRLMILSPIMRGRKGEAKSLLREALSNGYVKAGIDGGIYSLEEGIPELDKNKKHDVSILIDRIKNTDEERMRLSDSVERAMDMSSGLVEVFYPDENISEIFSEKDSCPRCGITFSDTEPRFFSFNSPFGACPECNGLGYRESFDIGRIVPDRNLSYSEGAIKTHNPQAKNYTKGIEAVFEKYSVPLDTPVKDYSEEFFKALFYGSGEPVIFSYEGKSRERTMAFKGIIPELEFRYSVAYPSMRKWFEEYISETKCASCGGKRLRKEALSVFINGKSIMDVSDMSVEESIDFFSSLVLTDTEKEIAGNILKEIRSRLKFLTDVGLSYLTLSRSAMTLSGGEAQRIRLATQIGSALTGVLYVLDEPSIGLHQSDNLKLISTLKGLRDLGNTVIVVEHDYETIKSADYVVDLGPGAGDSGGFITAIGTPDDVEKTKDSVTGMFLSGALEMPVSRHRKGNGKSIIIRGCSKNNLKNIDVSIQLGAFTCITGVSGSGKSTLLNDTLVPAIKGELKPGQYYQSIEGTENIDKVISIDQSPIGRTPRSVPATYVGVYSLIRNVFASTTEAKAKGYDASRFSFNVHGGRCENCDGEGEVKIEMHFLPDVFVKCDVCDGKRFNKETLSVKFKGKSIYDVLDMTVSEAYEFFSFHSGIKRKLGTLMSVGLDYIKLGQSAVTLSGGEAQRIKLALELSKKDTGRTLYVLDEPTTGLHAADVKKLLSVLQRFVEAGNTVVLIEHNMDVIKQSDMIIDLGPEGGNFGGRVVVTGSPEEVCEHAESRTGEYLKRILSQ